MKELLIKGLKFIGFSGIGWLIDTTIYMILTSIFKLNIDISNIFSSLVGVTFVFIMSTRKIFVSRSKINIKIKYLIYVIYQVILIITVSKLMLLLKSVITLLNIELINKYINIIVKIIITPFTMVINFIVMKLLIEKI